MDPMLQGMFHEVRSAMQDMQTDTKANTRALKVMAQEIEMMSARMDHQDQTLTKLLGTFASIEEHLVKLFEWKQQIETRVTALEQQRPPAA